MMTLQEVLHLLENRQEKELCIITDGKCYCDTPIKLLQKFGLRLDEKVSLVERNAEELVTIYIAKNNTVWKI